VVVYEMLTGRVPFCSDTPLGYVQKHVRDEPPPFKAVAPSLCISTGIERVVMKALRKRRGERQPSALEFARELAAAVEPEARGESSSALSTTVVDSSQSATHAPAPSSSNGPAITTRTEPSSAVLTDQPALAKAQSRKSTKRRLLLALLGVMIVIGIITFLVRQQPQHRGPLTVYKDRRSILVQPDALDEARSKGWSLQPPNIPANLFEFVQIPAGEFDMGCSPGDGECRTDEKPRHHVRISKGFEIGKYLITQAMWESVMGNNPSHFRGADRPVDSVSWNDVQEFLQRLNARNDGYRYRLPTEAEWEYAARAGSTSARYGNLDAIAWYTGNSGNKTHPVGQKQPNAWGLYDMLGNLEEWVQDWSDVNYYGHSPGTDPLGPSSGERRVLRGYSCNTFARYVRVSTRGECAPGIGDSLMGVRCVRETRPRPAA
jgi:formylglycine-generating enzyme required for sulfatase activity